MTLTIKETSLPIFNNLLDYRNSLYLTLVQNYGCYLVLKGKLKDYKNPEQRYQFNIKDDIFQPI